MAMQPKHAFEIKDGRMGWSTFLPSDVTNETTTHTPGPWHVGIGNGEGSVFANTGRMRLEDGGTTLYPVASVNQGIASESEANARLIAAAPALLAACERVRAMLDDLPIAADSPQALILGRANAYAELGFAIAQATGQAVQA